MGAGEPWERRVTPTGTTINGTWHATTRTRGVDIRCVRGAEGDGVEADAGAGGVVDLEAT